MEVCLLWVLCVVRGPYFGLITHPEESYRLWCVIVCDIKTSRMRRSWSTRGCRAINKQTNKHKFCLTCSLASIDAVKDLAALSCSVGARGSRYLRNVVVCGLRAVTSHKIVRALRTSNLNAINSFPTCTRNGDRHGVTYTRVALMQLILLMMSTRLLETCRELK